MEPIPLCSFSLPFLRLRCLQDGGFQHNQSSISHSLISAQKVFFLCVPIAFTPFVNVKENPLKRSASFFFRGGVTPIDEDKTPFPQVRLGSQGFLASGASLHSSVREGTITSFRHRSINGLWDPSPHASIQISAMITGANYAAMTIGFPPCAQAP